MLSKKSKIEQPDPRLDPTRPLPTARPVPRQTRVNEIALRGVARLPSGVRAHAVLQRAVQNPDKYPWLTQLLARWPFKVVAVVLAN